MKLSRSVSISPPASRAHSDPSQPSNLSSRAAHGGVAQYGHADSLRAVAAGGCNAPSRHLLEEGDIPQVTMAGAEPANIHTHAVTSASCARRVRPNYTPWRNEDTS